jgi:Flp pilus assembly protein TadG
MTTTGQPEAERGQCGQAAVELALVLPLVLLLFLGLVQVGLVVRDDVLLVHAAREAARRAAVDRADGNARTAAINGSGLTASRLDVRTTRDEAAGTVSETLRYRSPTGLPLIGPLLPDITLEAKATMRTES